SCSVGSAAASARVACGRRRQRSKWKCTSSNTNSFTGGLTTWIVTVSDALLLSCGQVTVTVTGTGPSCIGAVHGVDGAVAVVNVPAGALHRYVTVQPIESFTVAVTVDVLPTSTVHGLQAAFTDSVCSGAGGGG